MSEHPAAFRILRAEAARLEAWLCVRHALWPDVPVDTHRREAEHILRHPDRALALLADIGSGADDLPVAFAEATLRTDYVNGCDTFPVAFLEGIHVLPSWRRRGIARALCRAVESWARDRGCTEFASDALLSNTDARHAHRALGFAETERVVFFRKLLRPAP
ncbi:MAG: GNAT family N-acetyltransferase [Gluconacetobacter diazotrophicus]|nr:GNAT family N-acetyltransferase [Gluconacetobacter diazotrophicus]